MKIISVESWSYKTPKPDVKLISTKDSWITSGPVANPMSKYSRYAAYRPSWTPTFGNVACVVTAEDGTQGVGTTIHGSPVSTLISEFLGPRLIGESAMATEKCYDMMVRLCCPFGSTGIASFAISALDLALWDLKGKLLDKPVYELLGGPARDEIRCYATGGDTDWYMELGFTGLKLPCPYGPYDGLDGLEGNVDLVSRVRDSIGPQIELMLDCYMGLDVEYGVKLAEALRPQGLKWMEEVLWPDDFDAHAKLRERIPWQTLATGEHWYTAFPFQYAASHHLVDIFQPDIQWVGGLTPLIKICAIAEAAGISVIPHGGALTPYGQHALYALPAIPWGEYFISSAPGVPLDKASPTPGMTTPKDGKLIPLDAPGFGVSVEQVSLNSPTPH